MSRVLVDSGIKWIGSLPSTWSITTVNKIFYRRKEVNDVENPTVLSLARDGVKIRDISTNEGQLAESYDNYHKVYKDDLMINPMDLISGANCSLSEVEGVISPAYINLAKKENIYPKYYDYFFKYQYWIKAMFIHGKGVSFDNRWTMNWETMSSYKLPFPKYEEQKRIANYIDKQCEKIDKIISDNNKEIELLEEYKKTMIFKLTTKGFNNKKDKDSNIKWIGNIPNNWKMMKAKNIFNVITDYVASGSFGDLAKNVKYYDDENYARLIRTMDVSNKYKEVQPVYIDEHAYNYLHNSNLFGGEIILPNIGASVGDVYMVPNLYKKMSLAPNSVMVKSNYNDKYYYYLFYCDAGRMNLINISESTAQPKFNKTQFRSMKLPVPPIDEQKMIVEYLDIQCSKLDEVIDYRKQIIEKLEEYKRSLIYECVTGKREV